jgi:hypothetical protein
MCKRLIGPGSGSVQTPLPKQPARSVDEQSRFAAARFLLTLLALCLAR